MSEKNKMQANIEDLKGKAKETVGKITGDEEKVVEGKSEQAKANLKKAGEDVKESFKDIK